MSSYRKEANQVAKETSWTFFRFLPIGIVIILILSVLGFVLSSMGLIGRTAVERKVFENSYQYTEARKTEQLAFNAQLAEVERKLSSDLTPEMRTNLEAQAAALRIQINISENR